MAAVFAAWLCAAAAPLPPGEEARARALFAEVRCVVCQNESIESSQAEIAGDLRGVVREQVAAGRSDAEIRAFLVQRYGEFVMFRPAFSPGNAVLWGAPFALVLGGLAIVFLRGWRRGIASPAAAPLTPAETARLQALEGRRPEPEPNDGTVT